MQFHLSFQRQKGGSPAGVKVLDTAVPQDASNNARGPIKGTDDHVLYLKSRTQDGWPIQRLIVACTTTAVAPIAMNLKVYIFDKNLNQWILLPGSAATVTPTKVAAPPTDVVPTYIDLPVLADASQVQADLPSPRLGEIAACVLFTDPGAAPTGLYTVSVGAILSTKSY